MAWQEARDGGADDGVRAKDHLLYSVKSRRSKRVQVESFPAWAVFRTTIKARAWQFAAKRHQLGFCTVRANDAQCVICSTGMSFSASVTARAYVLNCRGGGVRPVAASPPAIAYSRVNTGLTPSAVPSSSNFPASHLGSELGLSAQSFRAFFISATRPTCGLLEGELLLPICIGSARLRHHDDTGSTGTGLHILHGCQVMFPDKAWSRLPRLLPQLQTKLSLLSR